MAKTTTKGDGKAPTRPETPSRRFGALLRKDREHSGLSQRELARRIGRTSATVIGNLEDGLNQPNIETLAQLGNVFQWDFNRIMAIFGAPTNTGAERIGSEVVARPALRRLVLAARDLTNDKLDLLASAAEGWVKSGQ